MEPGIARLARRAPRHLAPAVAVLLACAAGPLAAVGGEPFVTPETSVRLVSAWSVAPPGADPRLGLEFTLSPGWHVYWKNPGDAGYAPAFDPAADSDLAAAVLRFPAPERFELAGGLVAIGYDNAVIYPLDATSKGSDAATARLAGELAFLVCAETCIPYETALSVDLPLGEGREDPEIAAALARWRAAIPQAPPAPGDVSTELVDDGAGAFTLRWTLREPAIESSAPDLFFEEQDRVELGRPRFRAAADGPGFEVPIRPLDASRPLPSPLRLVWTATGFARAGAPLAFEGVAELWPPRSSGLALAWIVLPFIAIAIVVALVVRARRANPSTPATLEAPR